MSYTTKTGLTKAKLQKLLKEAETRIIKHQREKAALLLTLDIIIEAEK